MSKKNLKLYLNLFLVVIVASALLISSCAIKVAPTGGEKDVTPPKVLKSVPENYSTSFNQKEIVIEFDEYVQLKEADKQIIISPIIKPAPEISVKNKNVIVKFSESLQPNTTYTINFGNSITDVHEGNAFEGYQFVFSTGTALDSAMLKGKVYFAENLKTEKGILVLLYSNAVDSTPYKTAPDYFTKTDDAGNFVIKNIRNMSYKIFALKETDGNYMFNSSEEFFAFNGESVNTTDTFLIELRLFKEPNPKFFIKNKGFSQKGKYVLVFNKPAGKIELINLSSEIFPFAQTEFSPQKDSLILWMKDTLANHFHVTLFNNNQLVDTILVSEKPGLKSTGRDADYNGSLIASVNVGSTIKLKDTLTLMFSAPLIVNKTNLTSIELTSDSVTKVPFTTEWADSSNRKIKFLFTPAENKSYKLFIPPGSLTSIFGNRNDSLRFDISTVESSKLGSVAVKLSGLNEGSYLLQLVNDKDEIIHEKKVNGSGKFLFEFIEPLKYRLRLVYDTNSSGKWDSGNYLKNQQPEKIMYYSSDINIRANWDIEQDWIIN